MYCKEIVPSTNNMCCEIAVPISTNLYRKETVQPTCTPKNLFQVQTFISKGLSQVQTCIVPKNKHVSQKLAKRLSQVQTCITKRLSQVQTCITKRIFPNTIIYCKESVQRECPKYKHTSWLCIIKRLSQIQTCIAKRFSPVQN